jgi:phage terminase large subunit
MEHLRDRDPDAYQHVWLGECRFVLDGAIYARELREAQEEGRITNVPYDPGNPVSVYFDLGWADQTALWFAQHISGEVRLIDFHQDSQRPFAHYLQLLQKRGYIYATMWLPHDAEAKSLGTGRSIEEMARGGWLAGADCAEAERCRWHQRCAHAVCHHVV